MAGLDVTVPPAKGPKTRPGRADRPVAHGEQRGFTPETALKWLLFLVFLVVAAGAISAMAFLATQDPGVRTVSLVFMLNNEGNPPTFVNYGLLILVTFLCATAARRAFAAEDRWRWHWLGLAAVFLFLGYDEAAQVHETWGRIAENMVTATGPLFYSWVVIVAPLVAAMALIYARFLLSLPRKIAALMLVSGAIYVGGALGMEMVGGMVAEQRGENSVPFQIAAGIEESMEFLGLTLFCYALLRFLAGEDGKVRL